MMWKWLQFGKADGNEGCICLDSLRPEGKSRSTRAVIARQTQAVVHGIGVFPRRDSEFDQLRLRFDGSNVSVSWEGWRRTHRERQSSAIGREGVNSPFTNDATK